MNGEAIIPGRLKAWGWPGDETPDVARVTGAHGDYFHLVCGACEGEILARTKASAFRDPEGPRPVTGDFVRFAYNPAGESRILGVLPRRSLLARLDPSSSGHREQILAVNFDTLFFTMSLNENFSRARYERFKALAADSHCADRVVVLLTKADLATAAAIPPSALPEGVRVSAVTGEGMDRVRACAAPGKTVAFVGSSGVGKSSLVNALAGEDWMATGAIQDWSGKGRHTTTSRALVMLPSGAMALDTPGLREFGLFGEDGVKVRERSFSSHRYRR